MKAELLILNEPGLLSYTDRRLDSGDGSFHGIPDSVRLSGKLWIGETDTRTYLAANCVPGGGIHQYASCISFFGEARRTYAFEF